MSFVYRCPFCAAEHRGEPGDVGKRVTCASCEIKFKIRAPAAADVVADESRVGKPRALLLWGGAAAFLLATGGSLIGFYLARYGWEARHRAAVLALSSDADDALNKGNEKTAYDDFSKIAAMGPEYGRVSDDLHEIMEHARKERTELGKKYAATAPAAPATSTALVTKPAASAPRLVTKISAPAEATLENLSAEQIVSRYSRSVALVKSPVSVGTAFVFDHHRLLTNYHVIAESPLSQLKVYFPSTSDKDHATPVDQLLLMDPKRDLAVVSVDTDEKPLHVANQYAFKAGQNIVVIGNPGLGQDLILENAVSAGIMSTHMTIEGRDFYQMSIAINPGNSGGPVFDNGGSVVGVVTLKAREKEGIAFCIPAQDVLTAIKNAAMATDRDIAAQTHQHNLSAVCRRVSLMSDVYLYIMTLYADTMQEATRSGVPVQSAIGAVKDKVQARLSKASAESMADIQPMIDTFRADKSISQETRAKIGDLWTIYTEAKTNADNPKGPLALYRNRLADLIDRRKNTVKALQNALGVDDLIEEQ